MNLRKPKVVEPVVIPPPPPDLECPECGWLDAVPVRKIVRSRIESGVAVSRPVGDVMRCAKCVTEYVVGPSGVYKPQLRNRIPAETDGEPRPKRNSDEPTMLRDADMPWERKQRR